MYVDAFWNRKREVLQVSERINGKRILRDLPLVYEFYAESQNGTIPSITGKMTTKHRFNSNREMKDAIENMNGVEIFESDVNVVFKTLFENYNGSAPPKLNVCFFDIETDFCQKRGYAPVDDPFNRVTAVSLYCGWKADPLMALVIKPVQMSQQEAAEIVSRFDSKPGKVILCDDEKHMLRMFLDEIEDADVLSGWNSEVYDVPYLVNRISRIFSEAETTRFCLWGEKPKPITVDNYGNDVGSYEFVGRVHLDYLDLYKKHAGQVEQSYSLASIGAKVAKQSKVEYTGNLDRLYREDFELFIDYSLQDTFLLHLIDAKLDYINLHNGLAHQECVLIGTTRGSVSLIETAITNVIHEWGEVVFNKRRSEGDGAAGAWVQDPVKGLHEEIGLIDLNSLYPSTIRACNMSTETIIGQVRHTLTAPFIEERIEEQRVKRKNSTKPFVPKYAEAWHPLFAAIEHTEIMAGSDQELIVDMEDGTVFETTAKELKELLFSPDSKIVISANGTLFDRTKAGIIPTILAKWYNERKAMQKAVIDYKQLAAKSSIEEERGLVISDDAIAAIEEAMTTGKYVAGTKLTRVTNPLKDPLLALRRAINAKNNDEIAQIVMENGLIIENSKIMSSKEEVGYCTSQSAYFKMMQQIRKILLNSLYGALLNTHCRFYDKRLGQSVTLTGRTITKHMASTINEIVTGNYTESGGIIVYGDTDSVMFSAKRYFKSNGVDFDWSSRDAVIELYSAIGDKVSESFPGFMHRTFNTGLENGRIIDAGLELVGSRGLFLKKKRYGILKYWEDGFRKDVDGNPGELKAMGVEIKRSDTPRYIQVFLEDLLISLLTGTPEEELREKVKTFKREFVKQDAWTKGMPKTVKNLTNLTNIYNNTGKCSVGHVLAAINWNRLREIHGDIERPEVKDGGKTFVCQLMPNPLGMTCVGVPQEIIDCLPDWFVTLPFDTVVMEQTILRNKLDNLFGTLEMDLAIEDNMNTTFEDSGLFGW